MFRLPTLLFRRDFIDSVWFVPPVIPHKFFLHFSFVFRFFSVTQKEKAFATRKEPKKNNAHDSSISVSPPAQSACLDVGLEEVLEGREVAGTLVVHTGLVGLGEELDGGEAADAILLGELLVGGGIDLSDDDILSLGGELLPCGGHAHAVAAPGSEELDKNVLGGIVHDGVVVLGGKLDDVRGDGEHKESDNDELEHLGDMTLFGCVCC